ncbi:MAG: hypothetical protein IJ467_04460 [Bacteroidaceae bacterium]|nr:hypothetical protein [Bacteroidaceae bacterium]
MKGEHFSMPSPDFCGDSYIQPVSGHCVSPVNPNQDEVALKGLKEG